jgi:hypothetical protein
MADLRPLGSEKLQGMDKINRILEIARYNEPTQNINENKSDYTIQLADGNYYGIVYEKNGYIVKKGINESELDYIEPMKNRKYHKSYSQAMKKINLLAGELNRIHEQTENINLIGEQKKFVLKTPKSAEAGMSDMGGDVPPPAPAPDMGGEEELDLDLGMPEEGGDEELDLDLDMGEETPEEGDEDVSFKAIQKLTGKLGQKIRTLDKTEGMDSEDIKYVLNSIISAVNLENLSEEDLEEILENFEEEEIDYDNLEGDMDMDAGSEEDLDLDLGDEGGETEELQEYDIYGNDDFGYFDRNENPVDRDKLSDFDFDFEPEGYEMTFDEFESKFGPKNMNDPHRDIKKRQHDFNREKYGNMRLGKRRGGMDTMLDEVFTESKVDKVLSKYFVITEEEKKETESKNVKNFITEKVQKARVKTEIKEMSETFEQELTSEFLLKENKGTKFLGKTNKNNLVFEIDGKQLKVSTKGELL